MLSAPCKTLCLFLIMTAMLVHGNVAFAAPDESREKLLERERALVANVEKLRAEQDLLLLQRALFASDSKYLVLDMRAGRGMLKYRNRLLRSFAFKAPGKSGASLAGHILALRGKLDGNPRQRQLVFGDPLVVIESAKGRGGHNQSRKGIYLPIKTRDLAALFFALEEGSRILVVN